MTLDTMDSPAADLAACPPVPDAGLFAASTGGAQVATVEGWSLFPIPVHWSREAPEVSPPAPSAPRGPRSAAAPPRKG